MSNPPPAEDASVAVVPCVHPHPSDMVGCFTCGQVGPDDTPGLEVVRVLTRGQP